MKLRTIIADPHILLKSGVRNLLDFAILIHLGRCGLQGATVPAMVLTLGEPYSSIRLGIDRLEELNLVLPVCRRNNAGRAEVWVVTAGAWEALTRPADFSAFPNSHTKLLVK